MVSTHRCLGAHGLLRRRLQAGSASLVIVLCLSSPVQAQTASQITPPSFAPTVAPVRVPVAIPDGAGAVAPPGSKALDITLADVTLKGSSDPAALQELRATLVGKPVKVSAIFEAARTLEARYARSGRVLVRVVVPAQSLVDGATLRLVVVDGFIEAVDVSHVPANVRTSIAAILRPLAGLSGVTLVGLERKLLLAADLPGLTLRSTLAAGSKPGATILVIEATQQPVTGFVSLDNTLADALGHLAFGIGVNFNSVMGAGETIYLRASGLPNTTDHTGFLDPTPRYRALAGGFIVPLGHDGLTFNLEGTDARTAPRHDSAFPGFGSKFQRVSARLRYPVVRRRALTLFAEAAFDVQDERVRIIDPVVLPLNLDKLRIARVAGDLRAALPGGGTATVRLQASFGIDGLGARNAGTALLPLSRAGEKVDFHKLEFNAAIEQPLAAHLVLALRGRAQTSFGEVMGNSEQIGIATLDAISALPSGTVQGDAGYVVRGELKAPFGARLGTGFGQLAPYGFGSYGQVRFEELTVFERRTTDAHAYGAGLRLAASTGDGNPGISGSVEYGRAHLEGLGGTDDRISFTLVTQF